MKVKIIRTGGDEEVHEIGDKSVGEFIREQIGADTLDFVNLRDGRHMAVNDAGYEVNVVPTPTGVEHKPTRALLPYNWKATQLYHKICKPGTTHQIVGDVGIFREAPES